MVSTLANYHKLGDLKQYTLILLWFWMLKVQPKIMYSKPRESSRGKSIPSLLLFCIVANMP